MMAEPIVYIDRSRIRPGKISELRRTIDDLVRFIEEREPQRRAPHGGRWTRVPRVR